MRVVPLVRKARKGNKDALLQLINEQQDDYYRLALTYMRNAEDAMDAMEDMIVSLYAHIDQLKNNEAFYSWSKTILVNRCKQLLKKQQRVVLIDEWDRISNELPDQLLHKNAFQQSEQRMDIQALLLKVSIEQREAIELQYFHDLDYETIAAMTQVSIGTVKSRIHMGMKKMRVYVGGEHSD